MLAVLEVDGANALKHVSEDKPALDSILRTVLDAGGKPKTRAAGECNGMCREDNVVDWIRESSRAINLGDIRLLRFSRQDGMR